METPNANPTLAQVVAYHVRASAARRSLTLTGNPFPEREPIVPRNRAEARALLKRARRANKRG